MEASIININDIVSVDIIENQPVYDIEVENNHNFYLETNTNKILVHNSGKSDFVDEMCLRYHYKHGWKTAFASPENKPNRIHAGKLISKLCGKWIRSKSDFKEPWYQKSIELIHENFKFMDLDGGFDLDDVLDKARQMIFKFGIKVLVIDPYNKVRLGASLNKNINEYTNDYLNKIDTFARKYDVLPILVAHPRKPSMNESAKAYEPSFYDIKGGGEFYDMSPHGLLVHRDHDNDMVKVKVLKVKFNHLGKNSAHCWLKWNTSNGRYVDFKEQHDNALKTTGAKYDESNWVETGFTDNNKLKEEIKSPDTYLEPAADFFEEDESPF